jgi:hypothetical protein
MAQYARVAGIWISGLLGSTIVGSMLGTLFFNAFGDPSILGGFAGALLFTCFRLWAGEARADADLAARLDVDEHE